MCRKEKKEVMKVATLHVNNLQTNKTNHTKKCKGIFMFSEISFLFLALGEMLETTSFLRTCEARNRY